MKYFCILLTVFGVSLVQIIIKFRFNSVHGEMPIGLQKLVPFIFQLLKDPYLWFAGITLLCSAFLWYFIVSRMPLGTVFVFASLSYPLIMFGSYLFLNEQYTFPQIIGCGLIVGGLCLIAYY